MRDAAYDSIPKATRAELHELFGRWLEEETGEPDARVRGDRRLPPRADLSVSGRARADRRSDAATRAGGRRAPRLSGPQGVHPRRRGCGGQPDLPRRRAAACRRSVARRSDPERPGRSGAERRPELGRPGADGGRGGGGGDGRSTPGGARARAAGLPAAVHAAGRRAAGAVRGRGAGDRRLRGVRRRARARPRLAARRPGALPRPPGRPERGGLERARSSTGVARGTASSCERSSSGSASPSCSARRRRRKRPPAAKALLADVGRTRILEPTFLSVLANLEAMQGRAEQGRRAARPLASGGRRARRVDLAVRGQLRIRRAGRRSGRRRARASARLRGAAAGSGRRATSPRSPACSHARRTRRGATTRPSGSAGKARRRHGRTTSTPTFSGA